MKKKLLFINGHLNTGGVEKSLLDILTHLDYDRYDVDLLLTELPENVQTELRQGKGFDTIEDAEKWLEGADS